MAASPINGDRTSRGGFRRSSSNFASIPQRSLSFHEQAGLAKDDAAANVLYTHPNVRIYKFQPPTDALKSLDKTKKTLPDADYPIDAIEVLPWRSRTEMLSAKGRLIIEKVQGSVHFLKAGDLIHTIMKNSQCWCVDGESKFVMRVGNLRYQRIEFPAAEDDEKKKLEEFKAVISKILRFEKTPCPFIRGFHVDLPEDAITPRRRGTWKRRESLTPAAPDEESPVGRKFKASRTMSMRMPPNSFPSKSTSQLDMERPRTASSSSASARFSFPDVRTESPTNYTSGEENTDSDRHDSESDRPESSHHSEADESDAEAHSVPILRSPLKNVQTISSVEHQGLEHAFSGSRQDTISRPAGQILGASIESSKISQFDSKPAEAVSGARSRADAESFSAENPPSTVQETLTEQEPNRSPSAINLNESDTKNDLPILDKDNVGDAPHNQEEITENQEVVDSGLKLSVTGDRGGDKKSQAYESIPIAQKDSPSKPVQVNSGPATKISQYSAEVPEPVLHEPQATTSDPNCGRLEDLQQSQTHSPKETAAVIAHTEMSPEVSTEDLHRTHTNDDTESIVSTDSFHTLLSDESSTAPESLLNTRPFQHRRELSEMTIRATSMDDNSSIYENDQAVNAASAHKPFPTELEPWLEHQTPGAFINGPEIRQRLTHRRSLSPLPPASILAPHHSDQVSPIPKELLQKAATLAVVKPIEIVIFVVHILSRIAQGATMSDLMSGDLFRRPGARRTATGTFDQNVRGRSTARDSEDEDDYGFGRRKNSTRDSDVSGYVSDHNDDAASFGSID